MWHRSRQPDARPAHSFDCTAHPMVRGTSDRAKTMPFANRHDYDVAAAVDTKRTFFGDVERVGIIASVPSSGPRQSSRSYSRILTFAAHCRLLLLLAKSLTDTTIEIAARSGSSSLTLTRFSIIISTSVSVGQSSSSPYVLWLFSFAFVPVLDPRQLHGFDLASAPRL